MAVTLKQIALRAGVSTKTASNVVNIRSGHYSQATYDRVMAVAAALGYTPNAAARQLRLGKSGLIALVVPDLRTAYCAELAHLVVLEAGRQEYGVLVDVTQCDPASELRYLAHVCSVAVDGILFDASAPGTGATAEAGAKPMVLLRQRLWGPETSAVEKQACVNAVVESLIARIGPVTPPTRR
jgi:LacI family repressor for deo operon, udp, cdd, tsx, nupC, and nupG